MGVSSAKATPVIVGSTPDLDRASQHTMPTATYTGTARTCHRRSNAATPTTHRAAASHGADTEPE
jgi:hypothetical protein